MYIMSSNKAEQFHDFHPAAHAKWECSNRRRSGQRTVEAQSGHSVRVQLSLQIEISFLLFVYARFSSIASGKEIVPVGEADAISYDDTCMNGLNGPASPIIVKPGDRGRPTEEMPESAFYTYAL